MDLPRPTTDHTSKSRRHKSTISPPSNETDIPHYRRARRNCTLNNKTTDEFHPLAIPKTRPHVRRPRIKEVPTETIVGPRHQTKTRSPSHPHQSKHTTLPVGIRRTTEIPRRTYEMRNHTTIQKPIRRRLFLHQKEKWEVMPH